MNQQVSAAHHFCKAVDATLRGIGAVQVSNPELIDSPKNLSRIRGAVWRLETGLGSMLVRASGKRTGLGLVECSFDQPSRLGDELLGLDGGTDWLHIFQHTPDIPMACRALRDRILAIMK